MSDSTVAFTPLPGRYFIFNFFEVPTDLKGFKERFEMAAKYVTKNQHFVASNLHHSNDPETKYPWVNYALFASDDVFVFGKPDPKWGEMMKRSADVAEKANPAGFREIASYKGNPLVPNRPNPESSRYLVTAVRVSDSVSDEKFEKHWKEWSGCDLLHQKLEQETDSLLYKRFTTNMSPAFRYTVRTEVNGLSDATGHNIAKELNNRKFPEGVEAITGFYGVAARY